MVAPVSAVKASRRFKILALDVDGTLLDHRGHLHPRTVDAVKRAAAAGIRPVLCTGRRYRRARPIAVELGVDAPLVCNSGSLVKDSISAQTLWRADLDGSVVRAVLGFFQLRGEPIVSFIDHGDSDSVDFLITAYPTGRPLFDEYVFQNREYAGIDPDWRDRAMLGSPTDPSHFHLCAIGRREEMLGFEWDLQGSYPGLFRTFVQKSPRYAGTMCEVLSHEASKWSAILHLAELWSVQPDEICAVGDDMNDIPMIRGAGLGVAMGHAPEIVLEAADHITADHENHGLAQFIEDVLIGGVS